jgi:Saxitoxin biosynthesis operon protein SxtJ
MHEDFNRRHEVKPSSDRAFGLVMSLAFAVISIAPVRHGRPVRLWAVGLSAAFVLLARLSPVALRPLNRVWTGIGLLLHRVTSPVVVAIVFYIAVVPTGLVMRACGKDLLRRRRNPAAASYWIPRVPPGPPPESMTQQF